MSTKIFIPSKELLNQKILFEKKDVDPLYPLDFYSIDRNALLTIRSKESYQSDLIFQETLGDENLLLSLVTTIQKLCNFVAGKKVTTSLAELKDSKKGSYATYDGSSITLSLEVLTDTRIPFHVRINCLLSTAVHEAFHIKITTPDSGKLLVKSGYTKVELGLNGKVIQKPDFEQLKEIIDTPLLGILINILEDRRIEDLGLEQFNGFIFNFDDKKQYAGWLQLNTLARKPYDSIKNLSEKTDKYKYEHLLKFILFYVLLPGISKESEKYLPDDKEFQGKYEKVIEVCKSKEITYNGIVNQANRLLKLFPNHVNKEFTDDDSDEYSEFTNTPLEPGKSSIKIPAELLEQLKKMLDQKDSNVPFPEPLKTDEHSSVFDNYKLEAVNSGSYDHVIFTETNHLAKQISKNLSFLDSRFNRTNQMFELNSGEIDEDELHAINFTTNLFWEEEDVPGYSLDIAVLLDESGSMGSVLSPGSKINQAKTTGLALALAFKNSEHINFFLYGHSTGRSEGEHMILYKYINAKEKSYNINSIFSVKAKAGNADGYAIGAVGDILLKQGSSRQKLLIVVSDGQPAAHGYGGDSAMKHVRQVVTRLEKQNVFVLQIAVDTVNSAAMFNHFIPYNREDLGVNLKKVLLKKLTEISHQV